MPPNGLPPMPLPAEPRRFGMTASERKILNRCIGIFLMLVVAYGVSPGFCLGVAVITGVIAAVVYALTRDGGQDD